MSEPASSILKLKFCNSSKVYQLYSPNKSSPHLTVRPTLVLDDASLRKSGKQGSYKQVIPGVVDSFTNRARNEAGPPNQVAIKWARGKETIARLACELRFYETELRTLQGAIVPRCYGAYIGEVDGYEVACLVLEWCAGEMTRDHFELNRQRMVAAAKIHTAGIIHGALFDKRHWVVGPDSRLRIVDFTLARPHACPGSVPLVLNGPFPRGCGELDELEATFGLASSGLDPEQDLLVSHHGNATPQIVPSAYIANTCCIQ